MKSMGVDLGERRTGIAVTDLSGVLALPFTSLECAKENVLENIAELVFKEGIGLVVVGIPRSLDGRINSHARWVQGFCNSLRVRLDVPVEEWDERLSTVQAERYLREAGFSAHRRRGLRDATAATLVLQAFLDYKRFNQGKT